MALPPGPSSGQISLAMISEEIYGFNISNQSLRNFAIAAGKITPDSLGEFYGYAHPFQISVGGYYMDSYDSGSDYITGGTIYLRNYSGGSVIDSWVIDPVGSGVVDFFHSFTGITGGLTVYLESSGVTTTWQDFGSTNYVTWGEGYPGSNDGNITGPYTSSQSINFGYWHFDPFP